MVNGGHDLLFVIRSEDIVVQNTSLRPFGTDVDRVELTNQVAGDYC